jgi:hypothetical protein
VDQVDLGLVHLHQLNKELQRVQEVQVALWRDNRDVDGCIMIGDNRDVDGCIMIGDNRDVDGCIMIGDNRGVDGCIMIGDNIDVDGLPKLPRWR